MTFELQQGSLPLLISMPHIGTQIPSELASNYASRALQTEDTDWHLDTLYGFARSMGASVLTPRVSRYVIDLNRPPDDAPMYPGASNTELCPTRFFTGEALYQADCAPDAAERERRRITYWQPYHAALAAELARLKSLHGYALLWDAHSIRSELPWLFEGKLPDLNIGTASGASADASISIAAFQAAAITTHLITVVNGRFKGGYITRHYGQPAQQIHAVQLEMCQHLYMNEAAPFAYRPDLAAAITPVLQRMLQAALQACKALYD
jgi:N-formylglutamate deformylase